MLHPIQSSKSSKYLVCRIVWLTAGHMVGIWYAACTSNRVNAVNCIRIIGIRISFDLGMARGYTLMAHRYNAYSACILCAHKHYCKILYTVYTHMRLPGYARL